MLSFPNCKPSFYASLASNKANSGCLTEFGTVYQPSDAPGNLARRAQGRNNKGTPCTRDAPVHWRDAPVHARPPDHPTGRPDRLCLRDVQSLKSTAQFKRSPELIQSSSKVVFNVFKRYFEISFTFPKLPNDKSQFFCMGISVETTCMVESFSPQRLIFHF